MSFCLILLLTALLGISPSQAKYKHSYKYYGHLYRDYYKNKELNPTKQRALQPNIVFILADDLGWNDVSWNNPDVIMPNLQSLASKGVILNQSYVQAICSPSRAAYLTGKYPFRYGFQAGAVVNGRAQFLPLDETLLSQKLKQQGYSTHLVGKWHIGHCRVDATPTLRGFDSFFGFYSGIIDYFTKFLPRNPLPNFPVTLPFAYDLRENLDVFFSPTTEYTTVPDKYLALYPDVADVDRRAYLAMVTAMDKGIGRVVKALKSRYIYEDTVIIFTSDNGGAIGRGGASNFPLRGEKGGYYEGGVRSPTFVHSPNFISNPGRVSEDLFHIVDWFPTLLDAAGKNRPGRGVDGKSQWEMLTNGTKGTRTGFVYTITDRNGGTYAIRKGRFKLIQGNAGTLFEAPLPVGEALNCADTTACPDCQLYDLQADPSETTDLVCKKPARVRSMFRRLQKLKLQQVPSIFSNTTFFPASAPDLNNGTVNFGWC